MTTAALMALPTMVACSVVSSRGEEPDIAVEQDQPIINGVKDTGHPAILALTMTIPSTTGGATSYAGCTGTMIAVNAATKVGYVMTAAHCVKGASTISVTQGTDKKETAVLRGYAYLDHTYHPSYNGSVSSPYDIAMIRVLGVDAATPVIPLLAPDNMARGTKVTSVGWGQTIRPNLPQQDGGNTQKNRIEGVVSSITTTSVAVTYANNGDICHGDSGGPVLTTVNGKEYAAAVHSYVTGPCVGDGYSVRASAHKAFIQGILDKAPPAASCDLCKKIAVSGENTCAAQRRECLGDEQCNGLRVCLSRCSAAATDAGALPDAGSVIDCKAQCATQFPFGAAPYNTKIAFCACDECAAACAGDTTCAANPACGMNLVTPDSTPTANDCNTCMNGGCCAEQEACGKDGHCYRCVRTPETPGCATDALYNRLQACRASTCTSTCN